MPRLSLQVALGVGAAGALVDVSSYARLDDGLLRRWGRDDEFSDLEPGTFSFVLDNADGRFTPENPSSPLSTKLSEGLRACVSVGGRLTAGTVRSIEPEFPGGDSAWATVRVTCEDGFGDAARSNAEDVTRLAAFGVGCVAFWPFDDAASSSFFAGATGLERPLFLSGEASATYGVVATVPGGTDQVTLTATAGAAGTIAPLAQPGVLWPSDFGDGTAAMFFGVWVTPRNFTSFLEFSVLLPVGGGDVLPIRIGVQNDRFAVWDGSSYQFSTPFALNKAHFLAASASGDFWVDGALVHSFTNVGFPGGASIVVTVGNASFGATEVSVSNMHVTRSRLRAEAVLGAPNETMYELVAQTTALPYPAPPAGLSESSVGVDDAAGSALDLLNLYLLTEQGDAYIATTGTLTSPTATLNIRPRTRPSAVTSTFDVVNELQGAPDFVRDLTNLVSRVIVDGPDGKAVVDDSALVGRAGRASDNAIVMLTQDRDRVAWGQDRLIRGGNTRMRIASVVIDAMTTPTDRSADILALKPGDRVRFTNLPSTVLGFDTWDGWFLGASETHTVEAHEFELHFTPVLPDTAVYDTDRYVDEVLTLSGNINAAVTSINIATTGDKLTTTDLPLTVQIDDEQLTVTACTSATPQVATVTRGVNGTTAASHTSGAAVTVLPDSIYAF